MGFEARQPIIASALPALQKSTNVMFTDPYWSITLPESNNKKPCPLELQQWSSQNSASQW